MDSFEEVKACRICKSQKMKEFIHLGDQVLTGVFPQNKNEKITTGPLALVKCDDCDLVQLKHSYSLNEMYGDNYGYRSGLNKSMVQHLQESVAQIQSMVTLSADDIVLDIGSNDCTLLKSYPQHLKNLIGIDPTSEKFKEYYPERIQRKADFFSKDVFNSIFPNRKAKIITSFSMFYDLPDPQQFMKEIAAILSNNGLWCMEQSYLPLMIKTNSYDSICHEHLEYYCLSQIQFLAQRAGLKILDVSFNDVNGGSFKVFLAQHDSSLKANTSKITDLLEDEIKHGYNKMAVYEAFDQRVQKHRGELTNFLKNLKSKNKSIMGLGASTKGNVLLQYCGISTQFLDAVIEVNEFKFGRFTPGTLIPIISEKEAEKKQPDVKLVLPWHFRKNIIQREMAYLKKGGTLLFPLPQIELVTADNYEKILSSSHPTQETISS